MIAFLATGQKCKLNPERVCYPVSKAAVNMLSKVIALREGPKV